MAKHGIRASRRKEAPRATIQATPTVYETTKPVGSAERFLDDAAKEALASAAVAAMPTPSLGRFVPGAVRETAIRYPDPLLAEAARLPEKALAESAARAEAYRRAMEAQNEVVRVASAAMSPVGNMVVNQTGAAAHDALTRQDWGGGVNTVSRVEAKNTTRKERERVAAIEDRLREDARPRLVRGEDPTPEERHGTLHAGRNPVPQTLATALGAEVDPMEIAKEGYRKIARGEVEDPLLSRGAARAIGAALAGYQGVETVAGATGVGNPNAAKPPKAGAPGHSLGARGAAAGYVAEKNGTTVNEVLKANATKGKDLGARSERRKVLASEQRTRAKAKAKASAESWLEARAAAEERAGDQNDVVWLKPRTVEPGTRKSKVKPPSDTMIAAAQSILDDLARGADISQAGQRATRLLAPEELKTLRHRQVLGRGDASDRPADSLPGQETRPASAMAQVILNKVLGSPGVGIEHDAYDVVFRLGEFNKLKARLAARPDFPQDLYSLPAETDSRLAMAEIARKPDLTESAFDMLMREGDPYIRGLLASREDISEQGLRKLWDGETTGLVKGQILARKDVPADILKAAEGDDSVVQNPYVMMRLASNPDAPPSFAQNLLSGAYRHLVSPTEPTSKYTKVALIQALQRKDVDVAAALNRLVDLADSPYQTDRAAAGSLISLMERPLQRMAYYYKTDAQPGVRRSPEQKVRRAGIMNSLVAPLDRIFGFVQARANVSVPEFDRSIMNAIPGNNALGNPYYNHFGQIFQGGVESLVALQNARKTAFDSGLGIQVAKEYRNELRAAKARGEDHVPMVLQRGVPLYRAERDVLSRGLNSPSMYAIDAFRQSSVGSGFRNDDPDTTVPYVIYQLKPDRFAIGKRNLTYVMGADGGTGESSQLAPAADLMRSQAKGDFVDLSLFSRVLNRGSRDRSYGNLVKRTLGEDPAFRGVLDAIAAAGSADVLGGPAGLDGATGAVDALYADPLAAVSRAVSNGAAHNRAVRRAFEDYIADAEINHTGVFSPEFQRAERETFFEHARRSFARKGGRHDAPALFARSAKGDHPVVPKVMQDFMHKAMREHPNTYAEVKSLDKIPKSELGDAIGRVVFVWPKGRSPDALSSEGQLRMDAIRDTLDAMGIEHTEAWEDLSDGRQSVIDAQKTSPFHMDAKGGDTPRNVRAAEGGGDSGSETAVSETPVSEAPQNPGGPRIVINPTTFHNRKDALCVAFNEAFRIIMEMNGFEPVSEPTDKQRKFFSDTAYADDEVQLRRTILARICTFDTSVTDPTDEQLQEALEFLNTVLEIGAPQNQWEQWAVMRIVALLKKAVGPEDKTPAKPKEGPANAAVGGGDTDEERRAAAIQFAQERGMDTEGFEDMDIQTVESVYKIHDEQEGGGTPEPPTGQPATTDEPTKNEGSEPPTGQTTSATADPREAIVAANGAELDARAKEHVAAANRTIESLDRHIANAEALGKTIDNLNKSTDQILAQGEKILAGSGKGEQAEEPTQKTASQRSGVSSGVWTGGEPGKGRQLTAREAEWMQQRAASGGRMNEPQKALVAQMSGGRAGPLEAQPQAANEPPEDPLQKKRKKNFQV